MGNTIRILSWNVNGMRAIVKKGMYVTFPGLRADIICFQETKAQVDTMPDLDIQLKGYDLVFNSAVQKGYSGTAILSRVKPLGHWMGTNNDTHGQEGRVITMEFEKFYLVNVYVPNSGQELKRLDYRKEWDIHLKDYLVDLDKKKPVIFTGDLNVAHERIDLARPDQNYNKVAGYTQVEIDGFKNFLNWVWWILSGICIRTRFSIHTGASGSVPGNRNRLEDRLFPGKQKIDGTGKGCIYPG